MKINFYDTRLSEDGRTILVKEKDMDCDTMDMINCPKEAVCMMNTLLHMDELAEEHCYMISMNMSCNIIGIFFISKGTVSGSFVNTREIYMRALLSGTVMFILVHNHPSNNAEPSRTDVDTTARIKEAGKLMGVRFADHIIIARNGNYYSFAEHGLL